MTTATGHAARVLRVLHLEDDPIDVSLVAATLHADGLACDIANVQTHESFVAALDREAFDVILADYQLPAFDGVTAQTIAHRRRPDVPFIFVSGTLGEEVAVERLKAGATDYVLKQRLTRLPSSVRRAIREAEASAQQAQAERQLRELNVELERRVAQRTAELATVVQDLELRERQLRESEARLQAVLDHSPALIFVKSPDGRYVLVNRQFEAFAGRPASEIVGRTASELFGPRLAAIYDAHHQQVVEADAPRQFEEPSVQNEHVHIYATSAFPLKDPGGRTYAICGIAVDVTERRHAEEAAKLARLEAEQANNAKSVFLSTMSHELRTPLNAILGFAQILLGDGLSREQQDSVEQILHGGQHLLELINEVLDIARVESGRLSVSPEPVGISSLVHHVRDLVAPLAERQGIELHVEEIDPHRYVRADRQRLIQILLNLISNGIKYNRPAGRVVVNCVDADAGRLRVTVSDTGYGISRDKLERLFRPFERLGAEGTAVEGTGLGLALSKTLAEAMGGTVGVLTTRDLGSTFWVELPASLGPALVPDVIEPSDRAEAPDVDAVHGLVLYIEDNSANVKLLERVLRRRPHVDLVTAVNGQAGLDLARAEPPDLILLDLHLPDMSGHEVLEQLSVDPRTRDVPVVVISADATPHSARRLSSSGAAGYLSKPFNIHRVLDAVDRFLTTSEHG